MDDLITVKDWRRRRIAGAGVKGKEPQEAQEAHRERIAKMRQDGGGAGKLRDERPSGGSQQFFDTHEDFFFSIKRGRIRL